MSDEELDELRARHPERSAVAFDAYDELDEGLAQRSTRIEAIRAEFSGSGAGCPILTTVVCLDCGASEVVTMLREWSLDRAMARTGIAERDLEGASRLIAASYAEAGVEPPDLDALPNELLADLVEMVRDRASTAEVREALRTAPERIRISRDAAGRAGLR